MPTTPIRLRVCCVVFALLLLVPFAPHLQAQQQDEGGGGAAPTSCPITAGNSCPPTDSAGNVLPKSNTDINGDGKKDWRYPSTPTNNNPIVDDKGNTLEIWCVDGPTPYYALIFTPPGGQGRFVGQCPFGGGCNSKSKFDDTDADGNGKPDCITSTEWTSTDQQYGDGDDDGDGNVDWYKYTYDVEKNEVWVECWESKDGPGDGNRDGTDDPDTKTGEGHGPPPEGTFDFDDLLDLVQPVVVEEEPVPGPRLPNEPTEIATDEPPMQEIVGTVQLSGVAVGGVVGLEVLGIVVEVETRPGDSASDVVRQLVAAVQAHPKLGRFEIDVEGSQIRMEGFSDGALTVHCTDPGIPVPSPVQNLRAEFDPFERTVHLKWDLPPGADYEILHVVRDGVDLAPNRVGDSTEYVDDLDLSMSRDALHEYRIVAERDGVRTATTITVPVLVLREGDPGLPDARVFNPR